ncbi:ABC transporter permease [Planctomycetota bacterium]
MSSTDFTDPKGKSSFPLSEAIAFSFRSLMLRLGRMIVVLLGISFAISFMTVLLSTGIIMDGIRELAVRSGSGSGGEASEFHKWWIVVAICIAAAGISNAVLMSVTERIKEIGTLKCMGARNLHIIEIFLIETLLLGTIGGFLGSVFGILITITFYGVKLGSDLWTVFGLIDALKLTGISILLSLSISLVSAIIPVFLAARIEPAEAMRYEV